MRRKARYEEWVEELRGAGVGGTWETENAKSVYFTENRYEMKL